MASISSTITDKPYFLEAASGDDPIQYGAADFRGFLAAVYARTGLITPGSFQVSQDSPVGWSIVVSAGYARVSGSYLVRMASAKTVDLNGINKNPSSTRTHKVWLAVFDKLIDGTEYASKIVVTLDTNGSGAPAPDNAAGLLLLATIVVNPGMSYISQSNLAAAAAHTWVGQSPNADWINIKPGFYDNYASVGTSPLRAVYHNGQVTLRGAVNRTNNAKFDGGNSFTVASVDSVIRPAFDNFEICAARITSADEFYCRVELGTDGQVNVRIPNDYNPTTIFLDGFTYFLD